MGFREDFVANLPENPSDAILALADRAQEWIDAPESPDDMLRGIFIQNALKRFIERYELKIEVVSSTPDGPNVKDYVEAITRFSGERAVDRLLDDYDFARGEIEFGTTALSSNEKTEVHTHIDAIRKIIEASDLPDRKKNALFKKLNRLAEEADRAGTRTDGFFAFAGDIAFVLGEMAQNAKPLIKEVKDVLRIVSRSRARSEQVTLPGGDELLRLPSPRKRPNRKS